MWPGIPSSITWKLIKNGCCWNATPGLLNQELWEGRERVIKPCNWIEPQLNALGYWGLDSFGPCIRKPWNYKMGRLDFLITVDFIFLFKVFLLLYLLTGQETFAFSYLCISNQLMFQNLHSAIALPSWVVSGEDVLIVSEFTAGDTVVKMIQINNFLSFCFWK